MAEYVFLNKDNEMVYIELFEGATQALAEKAMKEDLRDTTVYVKVGGQ